MNKIRTIALGVFIFALLACEQPFKAGLGPVVDIRPPTVTVTSPGAGEYIHGEETFRGTAEDDYKLDSVWFKILNIPKDEYKDNAELISLREYTKIASYNTGRGNWSKKIDTTKFDDGDFTIQLKVIDSVRKEAETIEIVFLINNNDPAINVTSPYIAWGSAPGQVGGPHLNFGNEDTGAGIDSLPSPLSYGRQMDKGGLLTGTISYDEDIYTGSVGSGNRYPPQIRIWEINEDPATSERTTYKPGVMPTESQVPWVSLVNNVTLFGVASGSYMFTYDLPENAGCFYGFEIRAQTKDGRIHYRYPRDTYAPKEDRNWNSNDDDFVKENRYVLLFARLPQELPTIELIGLDDILGENAWISSTSRYKLLDIDETKEAHDYISRDPSNKNGDFILRLKTSHAEGISSTEVYWEKDDKTERGLFIWDAANTSPYASWSADNNVATTEEYSSWGYRDPNSFAGGFYRTRNFIFTYTQPANGISDARNLIPNTTAYNSRVRNRTKVQRYTGTDWANRGTGAWSRSQTFTTAGGWQNVEVLTEGVYNIEVYTTSDKGTPLTVPFRCSIRLDRTAPKVEINSIEGAVSFEPNGTTVVNGVIKPQLNISDSQAQDSGLRPATGYYTAYEQRYVLIPAGASDANKNAFNALIQATKNWWPPEPLLVSPNYVLNTIGTIPIAKHGPVADSKFMFKTSKVYDGTDALDRTVPHAGTTLSLTGPTQTEDDTLSNGSYYLYVFVRDNAFNVGSIDPLKIEVDHLSDFPFFDFTVGSVRDEVTNPSVSADNKEANTGFRDREGQLRNSLGPGTSIRLRMSDDDDMDLGHHISGNNISSIKVSITGSNADAEGNVTPLGSGYELELSSATVKALFPSQQTGQGDITQAALLTLLKGSQLYKDRIPNLDNYTSLPDGIYRIRIKASDYALSKLNTVTTSPAVASREVVFWVAMDSVSPVISDISPPSGRYIASGTATIEGKVTDQNGPISGEVVSVVSSTGTNITSRLTSKTVTVTKDPADATQWAGDFKAEIGLPADVTAGNYIFTLRFTDRFGKESTVDLRYQFDDEKPTVGDLNPIKTFARTAVKAQVSDYLTIPDGDFLRLTNGFVSFSFTAKDNLKVTEARWWLVPDGQAPSGATPSAAFDAHSISSIATGQTMSLGANMKGGRLTDNFSGKTWYVDTKDLNNTTTGGRYVLYAMAKDEANNYSVVHELQTIYVLQPEDKPWFGASTNITPNTESGQAAISASQAVVRGNIYEDDGFFNSTGGVLDGSVRIYMSTNVNAALVNLGAAITGQYGYIEGTLPSGAVARAGSSSNIILNIPLREITEFYDGTPSETKPMNFDGEKHYVIEATDSWFGKFITETGTQATAANTDQQVKNRKYFSFKYDSKDPVITIDDPTGASLIYGRVADSGNNPFSLTATITDRYLDIMENIKNPDGSSKYPGNKNYYIMIRVDAGSYNEFDLGFAGTAGTSSKVTNIANDINSTTQERTIKFTIPANVFTTEIGYDAESFISGTHTLSFQVKDESGKIGTAGLSFLKDMDPPTLIFRTINGEPLPLEDWWGLPDIQDNFVAKRTALGKASPPLSVISYDGTSVLIQGSLSDAYSNINNVSFKYYLDNATVAKTDAILSASAKNVSWQIPLSGINDGVHSIRIEVEDVAGNKLAPDVYYGFILVSAKPTIALDTTGIDPVMGDYHATGITGINGDQTVFVIGGTAASASLADVKLKVSYIDKANSNSWSGNLSALIPGEFDSDNLVYTNTPSYKESRTWTYNVPRSVLYKAGNSQPAILNGSYEITAIAVDNSGAESDETSWTFIIDSAQPKFEFSTPRYTETVADRLPAEWLLAANKARRIVISSSEPKLQARISDTNKLVDAEYLIRKYDYVENKWGNYCTAVIDSDTGVVDDWTDSATESWTDVYKVGGTDYAWSLDIKKLEDGYYSVQLRTRDESKLYNNATNSGNWNNTGATAGNGNPITSDYGYFFLSRGQPQISSNDTQSQFSSRVINGNELEFSITAKDPNWFEQLTAKVDSPYPSSITMPVITGQTYDKDGNGEWTAKIKILFNPNTGTTYCADGAYRITFTVTNMAGSSATTIRTIYLDNTPPNGAPVTPRTANLGTVAGNAYPPYAAGISVGEIINGGFDATINGTNEDRGASASGVKEVWYHLGYVGTAADSSTLAFPTEDTIRNATEFADFSKLVTIGGKDLGNTIISGDIVYDTNNKIFDAAAKDMNTAWFKYDPDTSYPVPHGVAKHGSDPFSWELIIEKSEDGLKDFARYAKSGFELKGTSTTYNNANGRWMVKAVPQAQIPQAMRKPGVYSMPLWVRVADVAGNVSYYCRDIWIYPNGDYPSNTFINPTESLGQGSPRGGQFPIEGVASDNRSVKTVIYRVKSDNIDSVSGRPTYNANWETLAPGDDKIVTITGGDTPVAEFSSIPDYDLTHNNPFGSEKLSTTGWHYATLESSTVAPTMPWSFMINAQGEIDKLFDDDTRYFTVSGVKYLRLYIEVFSFDGVDERASAYNKVSLGGSADETAPRADVRVLYVKSSAPVINTKRLSNLGAFDTYTGNAPSGVTAAFPATDYSADNNLRNRRFAVRMNLNGNGSNIGVISVRVSGGGTTTGWYDVYNRSSTVTLPTGVNFNPATFTQTTTMTYSFDSLITAAANGFAAVRSGAWANTGGTLTVDVRIRDVTTPQYGEASTSFIVGIDNFAPLADEVKNITPKKAAGSNVMFLGRAFDNQLSVADGANPSQRGIKEVYAWFTRNINGTSNYVNMNSGAVTGVTTGATTTTTTRHAWTGRKATIGWGGTENNVVSSITVTEQGARPNVPPATPNVTYPTGDGYFKLLNETAGATMGSGVIWQPDNNNSSDIYWSFSADTTRMPDGWMYLNYLVIDNAGNASLYQQHMVVMNNSPEITRITLYTDNRGEGAAFTTHDDPDAYSDYEVVKGGGKDIYDSVGYLNSGFISKNKAIGFGVQTVKGNAPLNYRVQYVERVPIKLDTGNNLDQIAAGSYLGVDLNIFTIKVKGNISDPIWNTLGVKEASPQAGNHFVFKEGVKVSDIPSNIRENAEVWGYKVPGPAVKELPNQGNALNPNVEVKADDFKFFGDDHFSLTDATKIPERNGSKPDLDEKASDDPAKTAFFLIKVWDSVSTINSASIPSADLALFTEDDQLYDVAVIGMNVYLSDHTNPTIRLYDLNPYTETAVIGNNLNNSVRNRTAANAAAPNAIGANILRGGLFNIGASQQKLVKSGYIDPRDQSTALKPWIKDDYSGEYNQQDANGYVGARTGASYPAADAVSATGATLDSVSGRIILRGQAWDDQLIDEIRVYINTTAPTDVRTVAESAKTILKLLPVRTSDGSVMYTYDGTQDLTGYKKQLVWPTAPNADGSAPARAWAVEELHWKTGHTVEWAYIWNTEEASNGTTSITVIVKDANGKQYNGDPNGTKNSDGSLTNGTPIIGENYLTGTFHNQIRVTIVPYVTGFERQSIYSTTRSRQGWYSFFQGETGIIMLGYNLGDGAPTLTIDKSTTAGTTINLVITDPINRSSDENPAPRRYAFAIPDTETSGRIAVRANSGTAVYNNASVHANKSWNRESNDFTDGSELWINKPHAHIWRTDQKGATTPYTYFGQASTKDTVGLSRPSMALEYAAGADQGRLTGVWATYGDADSYYARNNNSRRMGNTTNSNNNDRGFYGTADNPTPGEPYLAQDVSFYQGAVANGAVVVSYEEDGRPALYVRNGVANSNTTHFGTSTVVSTQDYGVSTQRWQNNRVVRSANRYHVTSYDSSNRRLQYFNTDRTGTGGYAIDGNNVTGRLSTDAGLYSAIDYDNIGPVVAYYDAQHRTLCFAYAANENPAAGDWTRKFVLESGDPLYSGSGEYVSIKVDRANGIHLAFYNSVKQAIVYAYASGRTGTFTAYIVDNVIKGGVWTDISVDNHDAGSGDTYIPGNPWIVYGETARMGNYDGIRMAYKSSADTGIAFTDTAGSAAGWEAVTMPANFKVKNNERLNIEAWPPTNRGNVTLGTRINSETWNAAIGYAGESKEGESAFRIGYFSYPVWKGYEQ
jgi:hypothetical protein